MPAQPRGEGSALADEPLAMIDQELQLPCRSVMAGEMELALFAQCRPGDCECVDRIGLAPSASALAGARHQLRRDAQDPHARGQQEALQAAVDVPAVL